MTEGFHGVQSCSVRVQKECMVTKKVKWILRFSSYNGLIHKKLLNEVQTVSTSNIGVGTRASVGLGIEKIMCTGGWAVVVS